MSVPRISQRPRAILLDVIPPQTDQATASRRLLELESLTRTYGGMVIVKTVQRRAIPHYRTYVGPGKLDELAAIAKQEGVELLVFNNLLKPRQIFNVEEQVRKSGHPLAVWDRVDLILKIFDKHATTAEAKLQIKLAAIRHMGPRIFGMGLELMQQAGGIGTRGKGETNIEIMRRHLSVQEEQVKRQLERMAAARTGQRRRRERAGFKSISIVGYTNAGKSTLMRALTSKSVEVADKLFATLDTRIARLHLPPASSLEPPPSILLSDTIGFIQDLPPQLIDAFRSTLDETVDADLLLHVIDVTDPFREDKVAEVESILDQLGVADTPKIYVFNKLDAAPELPREALSERYAVYSPVFVSAATGEGFAELRACLAERLRVTV